MSPQNTTEPATPDLAWSVADVPLLVMYIVLGLALAGSVYHVGTKFQDFCNRRIRAEEPLELTSTSGATA
jgi:hypothetical protein